MAVALLANPATARGTPPDVPLAATAIISSPASSRGSGSDGSAVCLDLGTTRLRCVLPPTLTPADLDAAYAPFWRPDDGDREPTANLVFDAGEGDVQGWRESSEVFRTPVWSLRASADRRFVVGTLFDPPRPVWVASSDPLLTEIRIARVDPDPRISDVYLVESVLRILSRIILIQRHSRDGSGLVVHAAAASLNGRIYLFLGRSGAGKSTLSRRLLGRVDATVVNDDRMILTRQAALPDGPGNGWTAWGTPWPGELGISLDVSAPLAALLVLEKCERTYREPLSPADALNSILPLVSVPWYDAELVPGALDLCGLLLREVPVFRLHFRPDESAVEAVLSLAAR